MISYIAEHWRDIGTGVVAVVFFYNAVRRPEDLFLAGRSWRSR